MELRQSTFALTLSLRHPAIFSSLFDDSSILCIPEIYVSSKINPNSIKDSTLLNHALRTPSSASSTPTEHTRLIGKSLSVSSFKTAVDSNHITAQFSGSPAVQSKFGTMVNNVLRRANSSSTLKLSPSQTWLTTDDLSAANNNSVGVDSLSSAAPAELFVSLTQKSVELHRETGIVRTREGFEIPMQSRITRIERWLDGSGRSLTAVGIDEALDACDDLSSILDENAQKRIHEKLEKYELLSDFLASENIYGLQATLQQLTECAAIITSDIIPSSGTSSLSDFAIKCSDSIDQTINRLLPDIMRHPLINRLRKALNFSEEHFVRLAENEVISHCYGRLMKRISSEFQHADAEIDEAAHKVRYIDTAQLGLWSQAGRNLIDAVPEFKQVSSFKTTSGKIDCLLRSIKILTAPIICEKEEKPLIFGSDQLVPMMLLLIVRSNIPQLISQLKFVEIFSFKRNPHLGQLGFTLSSFEAVLSYICSAGSLTDLMKTSDRNVRLWECIASQAAVEAIDKLTEILGNANSVNSCSALANSHPPKSPISAFPHHSLLDILTEAGDNCLMVAVRSGQIEMISYLLEVHSFSIQNSVNFSGQTVLHVAVEEKLPHIVRFLLGYCGDVKRLVDFVDRQGQTALHIACVHANVEIINSLLSANASCNLRDNLGNLPVFIYARTHISLINRDVFKLLLEPLTLEVARNNAGETIFHILKDREIAELAAKTIGDINTSKSLRSIDLSTGCTPLHRACICDAVGMIDYLLGNNSINSQLFAAVDKFSDTCIHVATKAGAFAALERLLGCTNLTRSMIDQRNDCGETALHLAAKSDRSDLIAALLEAGADPRRKNSKDQLPADLCVNGSAAQDLLDRYFLLRSKRRIAVFRAVIDQSQAVHFVVKNNRSHLPEAGEMKLQLVFRTLQDFVWLRRQLLLQFNEAILPELSTETDSSATRIEKPLHQLIARQVNRLDRFLGDLLAHPEISQDSTFIDFITALVLDKAEITTRKKLELAEKRPQELERFRRSMEFSMQDAVGYLRAVRNQLLALEAHVSSISTKARSLAQDRSILSIKLRQLPVLFNSADFILQFSALFTSQARTSELHLKDSLLIVCEDMLSMSQRFLGCQSALRHFATVRTEYQQSFKSVERIKETIERLEFQVAKINQVGEEVVMKLSEQYYELKQAELLVEEKIALLNFSFDRLKSEIAQFHQLISSAIRQIIGIYSASTLQSERNLLQSLKSLSLNSPLSAPRSSALYK